jgi:hypothetical protein
MLMETIDAVNDPIILRCLARAINNFRDIEDKLLSVGTHNEQIEH